MRFAAVTLLSTILALNAGCRQEVPASPPPAPRAGLPEGDPVAGKAVFMEMRCWSCHEIPGGDMPKPVASPPVPVYLVLPVEPAFTPVLEDIRAGATVLDLGCGTGRLANELARWGHAVHGVDESAAMLTHVHPDVRTVQTRIQDLDLGRRFDVVVLASQLVNVADGRIRQ